MIAVQVAAGGGLLGLRALLKEMLDLVNYKRQDSRIRQDNLGAAKFLSSVLEKAIGVLRKYHLYDIATS